MGITDASLSPISKEELFILSSVNLYLQPGEVCRIQGYCKPKHDSESIPAQGLVRELRDDLQLDYEVPVTIRNFTSEEKKIRKGTRVAIYCCAVEKLSSLTLVKRGFHPM